MWQAYPHYVVSLLAPVKIVPACRTPVQMRLLILEGCVCPAFSFDNAKPPQQDTNRYNPYLWHLQPQKHSFVTRGAPFHL